MEKNDFIVISLFNILLFFSIIILLLNNVINSKIGLSILITIGIMTLYLDKISEKIN